MNRFNKIRVAVVLIMILAILSFGSRQYLAYAADGDPTPQPNSNYTVKYSDKALYMTDWNSDIDGKLEVSDCVQVNYSWWNVTDVVKNDVKLVQVPSLECSTWTITVSGDLDTPPAPPTPGNPVPEPP